MQTAYPVTKTIERRIEQSTLDQLLDLYKTENEKRISLQNRIHVTLEDMSRDESLELVDQWEELDDDCHAIATAIADRLTDTSHKKFTEIQIA